MHRDVVRLQREFRDELFLETDADQHRPRALGEEAIIVPPPAPHAVAVAGEGDAGDDDQLELRRGDAGRGVGERLEQTPAGGVEGAQARDVVEVEFVVPLYFRVTGAARRERLPEEIDVGLARQRGKEADAPGVAPLGAGGHGVAKGARAAGAFLRRNGGEPGADEGAEFRLGHEGEESA